MAEISNLLMSLELLEDVIRRCHFAQRTLKLVKEFALSSCPHQIKQMWDSEGTS
jgi:hypothetical protein